MENIKDITSVWRCQKFHLTKQQILKSDLLWIKEIKSAIRQIFHASATCAAPLRKMFPWFCRFAQLDFFQIFLLLVRRFSTHQMFFILRNMWEIRVSSLKKTILWFRGFIQLDFSHISCYWFAGFRSHKVRFSRLSERVTQAIYNVVIVQTVKSYTVINNAMPEQSILMTLSCSEKTFLVLIWCHILCLLTTEVH